MATSLKIYELSGRSLTGLFDLIEKHPAGARHIFRGQSNTGWQLVPTLFRFKDLAIGAETLEKSYEYFEQGCLERFFNEGLPYLPPVQRGYSNDRILAQHFGVPTRFLDWSRDPLVAAFFAVEDWWTETDAAIYMVLPDARYKPEHVSSLGPHKVIAFDPPAMDRRIPAQKSIFTFHPYGPPTEPFVPLDQRDDIGNQIANPNGQGGVVRGFGKIIIPQKVKRHLHQTLSDMGIDRRNLFPGLEGVGAEIAARCRTGRIS